MNVVCSVSVEEAQSEAPDILVLPERTTITELEIASRQWPNAIIVGAVEERRHVRGYVLKGGENRIDYLKFCSDSISDGTFLMPVNQTFEDKDVALGVLICKDFQQPLLLDNVMNRFTSSQSRIKIVCIPADMGSEWFPGGRAREFIGAYVALSNNQRTPTHTRRKSFILGPNGVPVRDQIHHEAISHSAP